MNEWHIFGFNINKKACVTYVSIYALVIFAIFIIDKYFYDMSWYGVLVGTGFLVGLVLAILLSGERGMGKDFPCTLIMWVFPFAIVGARLYYVLFRLEHYTDFWSVIAVWEGGLAIYGGVIAGVIAIIIACKLHKESIVGTLDILAPCLIIGQAIGRWGNFVNQEAYGPIVTDTSLQWFPYSVFIESTGTYHMATFFYESLWCFVGCIVLILILRRTKIKGVVLCSYGVIYGFERFFIEQLREDSLYLLGLRVSQWVSLIIFIAGVIGIITLLFIDRKRRRQDYEKDNTLQHN